MNRDQDLPGLVVEDVEIRASSLTEAWTGLSTAHLAQSILVAPEDDVEARPFLYRAPSCRVHQLLDALAVAYGLAWLQDGATGVIWLFPRATAYSEVLPQAVRVGRDQFGLPMQTGILEPLAASATGIAVKTWGTAFRNTFDYAVDVPAGDYTVRDILNRCCGANPTKAFFVGVGRGPAQVTALNLVSDQPWPVPAGARWWWARQVGGGPVGDVPTAAEVMAALAHGEARVRAAARGYLEAVIWHPEVDEWPDRAAGVEQALWTIIGLLSVLVRTEEATHHESMRALERHAGDAWLSEGPPGLALIAALEILRLTKNPRALEVVNARALQASGLAGVTADACRIAAASSHVRRALPAAGARALELMAPLAALVRSPTGGTLEFSLAHP